MKRTRSAKVCWNGEFAGLLTRFNRDHYVFEYDEKWFFRSAKTSGKPYAAQKQAQLGGKPPVSFFCQSVV